MRLLESCRYACDPALTQALTVSSLDPSSGGSPLSPVDPPAAASPHPSRHQNRLPKARLWSPPHPCASHSPTPNPGTDVQVSAWSPVLPRRPLPASDPWSSSPTGWRAGTLGPLCSSSFPVLPSIFLEESEPPLKAEPNLIGSLQRGCSRQSEFFPSQSIPGHTFCF